MKDKLKQLHEQLLIDDDDEKSEDEDDSLLQETNNAFMKEFFSKVEEIRRDINVIGQSVEKIKHNNSAILATLSNEVQNRENEEMGQQIKHLSRKVHSGLKRINQELRIEESGPDRDSVNHRIKMAHHVNLSRKFHEVMMNYSLIQEDYRDKSKVMIQRQLQVTTGKQVSEDDVDKMIETGSMQVFTQDILVNTSEQRQVLNEVEQRHREMSALQQDITELHDMFVDVAALVHEQGEVVNNIEYHVESTAHHVKKGVINVEEASELKKSVNRKRCILLTICLVTLLAIALIIAIIVAVVVTE